MSSSFEHESDTEQVIYRYARLGLVNGRVLITNERLILGKEVWPIRDVQNAEVVSQQILGMPVPLNKNSMAGFSFGFALGVSGLLLIVLAPQGEVRILFVLASIILFVLSAFVYIRTYINNPITMYKVRLTLSHSSGNCFQREASYIWMDKWHTAKAVSEIQRVVNGL